MKEKFNDVTQKFSRAILQPVMFMSVTGILISVGVIFRMDIMPNLLKLIGDFLYNLMMNAGINQLSVIFCVGITTALARSKKVDAAILSISIFLIFIYANNAWLTSTGMLIDAPILNGTGQAFVLGVQVVDMGVFLGIILGCLTGYIHNKYSNIEFPDAVRVYGGSRFAYFIAIIVTILMAIGLSYFWPVVNNLIAQFALFIEKSGNFGLFIYGFLNRFLIPTGLHHLIYMPFLYTAVGGTAQVAGQVVEGGAMIWNAQLGIVNQITAIDPSIKYMMFGFSKVFGCIGLTLAFVKTAKKDRKDEIKATLLPLLFVAVLAGITEPIEFVFMFASPLLWLVHSLLDGIFQVIIFVLGSRFPFSSGIIAAIPAMLTMPVSLTKWYITFGVGIIGIATWYIVFVYIINKLNLKTPGREDENNEVKRKVSANNELGDISDIIIGLGGPDNIIEVNNCFTRLRVNVNDPDLVDDDSINKFKNSGIVRKGSNIQIIIGMKVQTVREDIVTELGIE